MSSTFVRDILKDNFKWLVVASLGGLVAFGAARSTMQGLVSDVSALKSQAVEFDRFKVVQVEKNDSMKESLERIEDKIDRLNGMMRRDRR